MKKHRYIGIALLIFLGACLNKDIPLWVGIYPMCLLATYLRAWAFMDKVAPSMFRVRFFVASFDMWIGTYLDHKNKCAYWFPIPYVGLKWEPVSWEERKKL